MLVGNDGDWKGLGLFEDYVLGVVHLASLCEGLAENRVEPASIWRSSSLQLYMVS
jgi:hypothetical protein